MKVIYLIIIISILVLVSCNNFSSPITIATVEVTRVVQITTTPVPTNTLTPEPTLNEYDVAKTSVANAIGTPIKAVDCYKAADIQSDINNCSNMRRSELELQMKDLFNKVNEQYKVIYDKSNTFSQFQTEWEALAIRECEFRSERNSIYGGSMALTNNNECLIGKYEDRLRELQIILYELKQ